ncbi:translocation/assembly module TamB domain-containing protein [Parablastomonas sp. CN1-191]|uniref:translocation/assembly module TamB domain-containing protein n=1 Tax=Parablastomonas sp. CN1-191 TaxID=3400908 RepID=UPI003BF87F02
MDPVEQAETAQGVPPRVRQRRLGRWLTGALAALIGVLILGVALLNSPVGHRFVAGRIAAYAPASGLRITVGSIDGSLYGKATLHDVVLFDKRGAFLKVPLAQLDWRPFSWFTTGLDVRELVATRGVLLRRPALAPGDPNAPILPRFDIRIDRLQLIDFRVAPGLAGPQARRVDLIGKADIRKGKAYILADGRFDSADRLHLLLDAEPAKNRLHLEADYMAPRDGVLAALIGAREDLRARITGRGAWSRWNGALLVEQGPARLAALKLTARSGRYGFLGQVSPGGYLSGLPAQALGKVIDVGGAATLANSVIAGHVAVRAAGLRGDAAGRVDLAANSVAGLRTVIVITDPGLLGPGVRLAGARLAATLDGPFRALTIDHLLTARELAVGTARIDLPSTRGVARLEGGRWTLPLNLVAARIVTGTAAADKLLIGPRVTGTLRLDGTRLTANDLTLAVPGLGARMTLVGDMARGTYGLAGAVAARGLVLDNLGRADATARTVISLGGARGWLVRADVAGRMARIDNATLASLTGGNIRFAGKVTVGGSQPLLVEGGRVDAAKLSLALNGRVLPGGRTALVGRGRHADYGPFTIDATVANDGPRAVLVFASPLPALQLKDVRVALSPIAQGFRIETAGGSRLGPFTGTLGLFSSSGGPTRIAVERLAVAQTQVQGSLTLVSGGVAGQLALAGGGVNGTVRLAPRGGAQGFDLALDADGARFGGPSPVTIAQGKVLASGTFGSGGLTLNGTASGAGIDLGSLFIGKLDARASVADGRGRITAAIAGRRGSRFALNLLGDLAPDRITVLAAGDYAGRRIAMPRRAVLTSTEGGWRLAPTQVNLAGGRIVASGVLGRATELDLALADMPLSLADIAVADLGLGGTASGMVHYRAGTGAPTGDAALTVKGLSRSGLVLSSRPIDLALVAKLTATDLEARAIAREDGQTRGRLQARIASLPAAGSLAQRLNAGSLFAQVRYSGPADALWRLIALETFDLTGPVSLAADATGSLASPALRGTFASDGLRLQSTLTGTDVQGLAARGTFAGSRLQLTQFAGRTPGGGTVAGSGSVDLSDLGVKAPSLDLRLAARDAALLNRDDFAATVTGPLRIVSNGVDGTIAGRLSIASARWRLGRAASAAALPSVATREVNAPVDRAPARSAANPWRYLIDASGPGRIAVSGLGLDSEWGADIKVRGTTAAPAILGQADIVRGGYEFAGKRFELVRGRIRFDGASPPNPRLDIAAEAQVTGLTARVTVTGTALVPVIAFSSTPALPEEELLARLLFGQGITTLSAPEALQLGAALASLRGGGGLDPINKLRSAVGLDRLRIVPADATLGRGTSVSVGKYLGRRFYAEIVTDGRGYSATQLEFRVTSWLSLLGTVSTLGRQSLNVKVQKDY